MLDPKSVDTLACETTLLFSATMDPAEYANLDAVEQDHWYYSGKRALVRWWLNRAGPVRSDQVLLDCGAGTGRFALEMQQHCRVLVLDDHEESLRMLRARFQPAQVLALTDGRVPLPDDSVDYVTALDVLEHVPDDAEVVRGFYRILKRGGAAVVTVPASMALWSDWDVTLHHFRRYHRQQLCALFPEADWKVEYVNYTNVAVFPAVWLVRKWRKLRGGPATDRAEDKIPAAPINALLRRIFVGFGRSRVPFPFGVSLLLVARKR